MAPTITLDQEAALTEAYHLVFDVKDSLVPGSFAFQAARDATAAIASMLTSLSGPGTAPNRHDGEGRDGGGRRG